MIKRYNYYNEDLYRIAIDEGVKTTSQGILYFPTGKFTGRSPKDRYFCDGEYVDKVIDKSREINQIISRETYSKLKNSLEEHIKNSPVEYKTSRVVCYHKKFHTLVDLHTTHAWANIFFNNMTINATGIQAEGGGFFTKWKVLHGPEFIPQETYEDLKNPNFVIIDFEDKTIIIGGTSYTGEIKKSIFTVLNTIFIDHGVLPMHCSANANFKNGKGVNLFFGLSGTGKTTLSSDPNKFFIGDDEHGWFEDHIFNFEGGCYAKLINLKKENEPIIWDSIHSPDRFNHTNCSLMENIVVDDENNPDFSDSSITENIRASYSLGQLPEEFMVSDLGLGKNVKNIFFLSFDAFGVLPPISKLDLEDAARFFKMGYTSKVAGTEVGITEPTVVFSTCFGSPFLPRKVEDYVDLFKEKVQKSGCNVWLVNTGFDENLKRYPIDITRKVINGVIDGKYSEKTFNYHGLRIPNRILDLDLITLKPDIEEERIEKLFELLDQH